MLYIIGKSLNGPFKVGYSVDPEKRLSNMNISFHSKEEKLKLIATAHGEEDSTSAMAPIDDKVAEAIMHQHFKDCRLEGEWFEFDLDDLPIERHYYADDVPEQYREKLTKSVGVGLEDLVIFIGWVLEPWVHQHLDDDGLLVR